MTLTMTMKMKIIQQHYCSTINCSTIMEYGIVCGHVKVYYNRADLKVYGNKIFLFNMLSTHNAICHNSTAIMLLNYFHFHCHCQCHFI